jgi:hypothetical protein
LSLLLSNEAATLQKQKPEGRVSLHLKALDADFSPQYEHIIPGHDLWSDLRGGGAILGCGGDPALSVCYVCGDCAASACAF